MPMIGPLAGTMAGQIGAGAASSGISATGIGSLLGGAGMFAGGLAGLFGGGSEGKSVYRGKHHQKAIKNEMKYRMMYAQQFGKKFGIHPLVAMGINPSSGPSLSYGQGGDNLGRSFDSMGQGLQKAVGGLSDIDKAQLEYINSMTALNKARVADMVSGQGNTGQAVNPINSDAIKVDSLAGSDYPPLYQTPVQSRSMKRGLAKTTAPLFEVKVGPRNRVYFTLGQDTSEGFESHLTNRLRLNFNDVVDYFNDAKNFYLHWTDSARSMRQDLRAILDALHNDMTASGLLKKNEQLAWEIGSGQPVIVPKGKFGLFKTGFPWVKQRRYSRFGND